MLNLLPKDQKKKITREYRVRFWVVAFALALAGEAIFLILLFPPYLTAEIRINMLNAQSANFKAKNVTTETANLTDTVRQTNAYLSAFTASSTPTGVLTAIRNIVDIHGSAVHISGVVYKNQNGQQQIVINGAADSRQALLDFAKRLKNQPGVISADLPVSDFTQAQNIDFSVTVLANPQHS